MTMLPDRPHLHYCGVDPGKHGAIFVVNMHGQVVLWKDMPVTSDKTRGAKRNYNVQGIWDLFHRIRSLPDVVAAMENPTTRPGESAEGSRWFGQGIGYIEMALVGNAIEYYRIPPNLWKGKLGVPGKDNPDAVRIACQTAATFYPRSADVFIRDSKNGSGRKVCEDGRADACLIAHFLRSRTFTGMKEIVEQFGRDSDQAWLAVLSGKTRHRKRSGPNILV